MVLLDYIGDVDACSVKFWSMLEPKPSGGGSKVSKTSPVDKGEVGGCRRCHLWHHSDGWKIVKNRKFCLKPLEVFTSGAQYERHALLKLCQGISQLHHTPISCKSNKYQRFRVKFTEKVQKTSLSAILK